MAGWFPWTQELDDWLAENFAKLGPQKCALELGQKADLAVSVGVVNYRVRHLRENGAHIGEAPHRTRAEVKQNPKHDAPVPAWKGKRSQHWTATDEDEVRLAVKALVQRKCNETGVPMMYVAMAVAGHALAVGRRAE